MGILDIFVIICIIGCVIGYFLTLYLIHRKRAQLTDCKPPYK
jgi:hypothetical protein